MEPRLIYHMCRRAEWAAAEAAGHYRGSSQDAFDGFIHFSTAAQIRESARKHRAGQDDLVLVTVDAGRLGTALKWEPSRGGALFPHLYGVLPLEAVVRVDPLPLGLKGTHVFPVLAEDPAP
ncbi:MAG TPA: DUF952 domain-containing protein [Stellaceae bacterium]|jgi:uncharacterized protein (DUF952 family)|nr:DUF952 domain-containing protein [Stellaceae bacterium]